MVSSSAATVSDYLTELPPERRAEIEKVRDVVNAALPAGYREGMAYGMIGWAIPLADYPDTYNKQPLGYAALAAQKNAIRSTSTAFTRRTKRLSGSGKPGPRPARSSTWARAASASNAPTTSRST